MMRFSPRSNYRLLLNAASSWFGFAVQVVITFLISPYLVRGLGDDRYGIWSMIESILAYLVLFEFGMGASVVRYVSRFETVKDRSRLNAIFSTTVFLFGLAGLAVFASMTVLLHSCWAFFKIPTELETESRWLMWLLGINLAVGLPMNIFASMLDGLEQYTLKHSIRSLVLVGRSAAVLGVVWAGGGLVRLAWVLIGATLLENVLMGVATFWFLPQLRFTIRGIDREALNCVGSYSLHAFLAMVANRISFQTDAIVIGLALSPKHIGWFMMAGKLVDYAKNFFRSITTVLTPAVSSLETKGDLRGIRSLVLSSSRYLLWLAVPFQIGFFVLGGPFLKLWLGDTYATQGAPVLYILALAFTLSVSQAVNARVLYGTGRLAMYSWLSLGEAALNLVLSLLLVRPLGLAGVAWGTTIPSLFMCVALAIYLCRMLDISIVEYFRRLFLLPSLAGVVPATIWLVSRSCFGVTSWSAFAVQGLVGVAAYGLVFLCVEGQWRTLAPLVRRRPRTLVGSAVGAS